jgi:hypothetical protein
MTPYIRPAVVEDCAYIAARMKRADVEECLASYGHAPLSAMQHSFENSSMAGTVCAADGEPVLMYGVGGFIPPDTGSPWMLSTDLIHRADMRRYFLRFTGSVIERMHRHYPILIQHVDARHSHALRWMLWAGFSIDELKPAWGVEQRPFFRLSKVHQHV